MSCQVRRKRQLHLRMLRRHQRETPQGECNLPGLSAIAYRTGTWATFKESMLARLSSSNYPALALSEDARR